MRVWHPAIPTPPSQGVHLSQVHQPSNRVLPQNSPNSRKFLAEDFLPQISQMLTEVSGCVYSPTDFTDAHRFLGCVFAPNLCTSVQSVGVFVGGYGILPYPRRPLRGCSSPCCTDQALVHQHCNPPTESTEFTETSGREEPPTEFTEFTEVSGRGYSPTDFTDAHRFLGCVVAS